jgi:hypothetical protein
LRRDCFISRLHRRRCQRRLRCRRWRAASHRFASVVHARCATLPTIDSVQRSMSRWGGRTHTSDLTCRSVSSCASRSASRASSSRCLLAAAAVRACVRAVMRAHASAASQSLTGLQRFLLLQCFSLRDSHDHARTHIHLTARTSSRFFFSISASLAAALARMAAVAASSVPFDVAGAAVSRAACTARRSVFAVTSMRFLSSPSAYNAV